MASQRCRGSWRFGTRDGPEEAAQVLHMPVWRDFPRVWSRFTLLREGQGQTAFEAHLKLWKALDTDRAARMVHGAGRSQTCSGRSFGQWLEDAAGFD